MTFEDQERADALVNVGTKKRGFFRKWWDAAIGDRRKERRQLAKAIAKREKKDAKAKQDARKKAKPVDAPKPQATVLPDALRFEGDYDSWQEACGASAGYDSPLIFEKTREAIRKVARGEAAFERDSVLFDEPQYPFSTIAGLLHVACSQGGRLAVLDFGGSLGSTYFACRPWLDTVKELNWSVVEQAHYVEAGRREFEDERLRFHLNSWESIACRMPDVILLSGVLQYLADPGTVLEELLAFGAPFLFLERTPFWDGTRDRIVVQHVPAAIYAADYPAWLFCESILQRRIEAHNYELVVSYGGFDAIPLLKGRCYFKGALFRRRAS